MEESIRIRRKNEPIELVKLVKFGLLLLEVLLVFGFSLMEMLKIKIYIGIDR